MSQKKINIAIAGATGFVGLDLTFLLSKHPRVNIVYICAQKNIGKSIKNFDRRIKSTLPKITNLKNVNWRNVDILFLSLPDGEAQKNIKKLIHHKNLRFIDLSGDFRIEKASDYEKWYLKKHKAKKLISKSIYAISEFVKESISSYKIISNPGCYPTSIQLPIIPLIKKKLIKVNNITIDSKSGYSGAGKNYMKKFTHKNFYSSVFSYGLFNHKHMAELNQQFSKVSKTKVNYTFNPHLLPTFRGILSSIYLNLNNGVTIKKIYNELLKFHKKNSFVKIHKLNTLIGSGNVLGTNSCEISICQTNYPNKIVIFSVIDNLIKGASGQAIQNMNLLYGYNEALGLK